MNSPRGFMLKKYIPYVFLFLLALLIRVYGLNEPAIFPDEITWMVRGKETFLALRTFDSQHILNYFNSAWWNMTNDTQAIALPLVGLIGPFVAYLGKGGGILTYGLFEDQVISRFILIVANSLFFPIFYYFSRKITSKGVSIFATTILLLDPFLIGISRIVINDSLLMIFSFLAIVSYTFVEKRTYSILLSAMFLSLAFLTKPIGILPVAAWISYSVLSKNRFQEFKTIVYTGLLCVLMISIVWPPSWTSPVISIVEYLLRQTDLVQEGNTYFFFGEVSKNPSSYFYIFQLITKLPIYVILAAIGYIVVSAHRLLHSKNVKMFARKHKFEISVFVYILIFLLVISFSPKKLGARYALPLWPFIYLSSAHFIYRVLIHLKRIWLRALLVSFLVLVSLFAAYSTFPYYEFYSNTFVGGSAGAQKHDLVGLCYGAKESVEYIKKCYPDVGSLAYLGCSKTVIPYYSNLNANVNWTYEQIVVIENSEAVLNSDSVPFSQYKFMSPSSEIVINGVVLSRIYVNDPDLSNLCGS
ncbi:ArnT family glycosyltransferase [Patescibacteria group bacterium]